MAPYCHHKLKKGFECVLAFKPCKVMVVGQEFQCLPWVCLIKVGFLRERRLMV
jgi:hypothetical protein